MKAITTLLAVILIIAGCEPATRESPVKYEDAEVLQLAYIPASEGRTSGGVGMTSSGKTVVTFGERVRSPEVYAVVLRCHDHQKTFSLTGKTVYEVCVGRVGQTVRLGYVEIIDDKNSVVDYVTKTVELKGPAEAR